MKRTYFVSMLLVLMIGGCGGNSSDTSTVIEKTPAVTTEDEINALALSSSRETFPSKSIAVYKKSFMKEYAQPVYDAPIVDKYLQEYTPYSMEDMTEVLNDTIDTSIIENNASLITALETYYDDVHSSNTLALSVGTTSMTTLLQQLKSAFLGMLESWFNDSFMGDLLSLFFDFNSDPSPDPQPNPDENSAPTASAQTIALEQDSAKEIILIGNDSDGDSLVYTIVTQPSYGTLSGSGRNVTYTPNSGYVGSDSFSFRVSDALETSTAASVTFNIAAVIPPNTVPTASTQNIVLNQGSSKSMVLSGADSDGDSLTYAIVNTPSHGQLSGTLPNITYTPTANYNGSDSFSFKVNDGVVDSTVVTITIMVIEILPEPTVFTYNLLKSKTFYVKSGVSDMTVVMSSNAQSGSGKMGFLSMSFTDYIDGNDVLVIDTSIMGMYHIIANYIDEGYCIAADATDEDGTVYESYWFSNAADEAQASNLAQAKILCYKNAP